MKKLILLIFALLLAYVSIAQSIHGIVKDEKTQEALPFANVILLQNDKQITGTTTDLDGNYEFSDIDVGTYNIEGVYVGYPNQRITEITVDKAAVEIDIEMTEGINFICDLPLPYVHPRLIRHDDTSTGIKMTSDEIMRMP